MSNSILEGLIKEKDYTFKKLLFKLIKDFDLTLEELLLLIYFILLTCILLKNLYY